MRAPATELARRLIITIIIAIVDFVQVSDVQSFRDHLYAIYSSLLPC